MARNDDYTDERRNTREPDHDNEKDASRRPSFIAYQVREGDDRKAFFNRVGAVFPHKDGKGHDVLLDALPVNGRVTLRTPQERLQDSRDDNRKSGSRSQSRNRDEGPSFER